MNKPILLDGAVGTSLWAKADARGIAREPVWTYNITHPEIVAELVGDYAAAGAQMILANTFGANSPAVKRSSSYTTPQVVKSGVEITKEALNGTGIPTMLSMGPLSSLIEPYGDTTEEECEEIYTEMLEAGIGAGADAVMIQTFFDLAMMNIAAQAAVRYGKPVFCTLTFEKSGKTIMGNSVEDCIDTLEPLGISGIGINCSLGPEAAFPIVKEFFEKAHIPVVYKPNAGLPISAGGGQTAISAEDFADQLVSAFPLVGYIGGCCGSDPSYIKEIRKRIDQID